MDIDNQRKLFEAYIGGNPLERTDTGEYRIRRIENDWQLWQEACASGDSSVAELAGQLESMDRTNEQLRTAIYAMMHRLTELLDEDQFAEMDALALRAGMQPPSGPPDLTFEDVGTAMDVAASAATRYTSEMGEAAEDYHKSFKFAHPLPAQWRWHEVWARMQQAQQACTK